MRSDLNNQKTHSATSPAWNKSVLSFLFDFLFILIIQENDSCHMLCIYLWRLYSYFHIYLYPIRKYPQPSLLYPSRRPACPRLRPSLACRGLVGSNGPRPQGTKTTQATVTIPTSRTTLASVTMILSWCPGR